MRNNTKTKITIEMNDVDSSYLFMKFLNELKNRGSQGGNLDVTIECDSGNTAEFYLGHDVDFSVERSFHPKKN